MPEKAIDAFKSYLENERHTSPYTVRNYLAAIKRFLKWSQKTPWESVTRNQARDFVIESQRAYSRRTLHNHISALRSFYTYLQKQKIIQTNPFADIALPKLDKPLPIFLTEKQMQSLLSAPMQMFTNGRINEQRAWHDLLAMELLYGAGLRVSELCSLTLQDIQLSEGIVRVLGKGKKERLCPIGASAKTVLEHYMSHHLDPSSALLLNASPRDIQRRLKNYLKQAQLPQDLTPHKIRHSYATHMLNNGASLRIVQALLGHASLSTTQIYTHVDIHRLKAAHSQAHPRA